MIQNKMKQKLNLHNKGEYQSLLDKRIIASLEKETEFLTTKIGIESNISFPTIIPTRIITILWREKHGTLMVHSTFLILNLLAMQTIKITRQSNLDR